MVAGLFSFVSDCVAKRVKNAKDKTQTSRKNSTDKELEEGTVPMSRV